jgi:sulfur relay protein TusB/DsrH
MLVIIKSAPDTVEGRRGVKLARSMSASLILLQNGVFFIQDQALDDLGFVGQVYVLQDDMRLRGVKVNEAKTNRKDIDYDGLVDLMAGSDKVAGMF